MIDISLLAFLAVVAVAIIRTTDLFAAVMLFSIYSLLSAALFTVLDAGDVALTEAAVGAGISTILMLAALTLAKRHEHPVKSHNLLALGVVLVTGAALIYASLDMPVVGAADNPANTHVAAYYVERAYEETGVPNMVAAVLASYRSIDTLGEVMVIFTAGLAVVALLIAKPKRRPRRPERSEERSEGAP